MGLMHRLFIMMSTKKTYDSSVIMLGQVMTYAVVVVILLVVWWLV